MRNAGVRIEAALQLPQPVNGWTFVWQLPAGAAPSERYELWVQAKSAEEAHAGSVRGEAGLYVRVAHAHGRRRLVLEGPHLLGRAVWPLERGAALPRRGCAKPYRRGRIR